MADWGICTTVLAPVEQVLAFVAHHRGLGASRIWLFFDDPYDPAFEAVQGITGVTATRCDSAYWSGISKTRPDPHQTRQSRNMRRVYDLANQPWVAHLDVDEFLHPVRPIAQILDEVPEDQILLRVAPWEALHGPGLPDDISTAQHFRAALKGDALAEVRDHAFGPYAPMLQDGVLSHAAGKCFFQRGFAGLRPRLHGAFLGGERVKGGLFHQQIALLHFHANDPENWKRRLQFRLTKGAYQFNPTLQAYLLTATVAEIDAFYKVVQQPHPDVLAYLASKGLLISTALNLRSKVATLIGEMQNMGKSKRDRAN